MATRATASGDRIIEKLTESRQLFHRLILAAGPSGSGKTAALRDVAARTGAPLINVNLELSRNLLELTGRERVLQARRLLYSMIGDVEAGVVLLDNTELLFDVCLKQDPLPLLQGLARNRTLVVAWNGGAKGSFLTYAEPGHPEYRKYEIHDFLVVSTERET
ncbi:MAG: BREX-3 system P-loop-containing protein BrxF [Armatimonadetes bacterium]|nr:BREX-3 system P-loop-containing protein BrxF [Armatimonadota bacterium]